MIRRRFGAALCVVLAWAMLAVAAVEGTPFENLAVEVDARREALARPTTKQERRQRHALRAVARELLSVSRGLKRDLRSAQKVNSRLDRAFPGDAAFDPLLDQMLDGFATTLSNHIFDGETQATLVLDAGRRSLAGELLRRARTLEGDAAAAPDRAGRVRLLRRIAQRVVRAEKAIAYVPPPVREEPTGDPIGDVVATMDARVDGVPFATNTVDGSMHAERDVYTYHLEAAPGTNLLSEISLDWAYRSLSAFPRFAISDAADTATVVIRRGSTIYDRETSGEIVITSSHATSVTGRATMTVTFRASASDAYGSKISVTGTFDVESMPFTTWLDN